MYVLVVPHAYYLTIWVGCSTMVLKPGFLSVDSMWLVRLFMPQFSWVCWVCLALLDFFCFFSARMWEGLLKKELHIGGLWAPHTHTQLHTQLEITWLLIYTHTARKKVTVKLLTHISQVERTWLLNL